MITQLDPPRNCPLKKATLFRCSKDLTRNGGTGQSMELKALRSSRILTDDDVDATDGEGSVSISGELSPSPKISSSGLDRPRDLPPRIPKREGSLRGRDSLPSPTADHASHAAASPIGASPIGVSSYHFYLTLTKKHF